MRPGVLTSLGNNCERGRAQVSTPYCLGVGAVIAGYKGQADRAARRRQRLAAVRLTQSYE